MNQADEHCHTCFCRSLPGLILLLAFLSDRALAELRVPRLFSDQMVLQRNRNIPVWGWADSGQTVSVTLTRTQQSTEPVQTKTAIAADNGKWSIVLDPLSIGVPMHIRIETQTDRIDIEDVLVGDVFLCSGQSNAAMSMNSCRRFPGTDEDIQCSRLEDVRFFEVPWGLFSDTPQDDVPADCQWNTLRPEKNGGYSAMAFYFARSLHRHLGVPIGIVRASHAGGMAEIKMPVEALLSYGHGREYYRHAMAFFKTSDGTINGRFPSSDWNGAIAPVIRYGKRGILWYQGEHNAGKDSYAYRDTLDVLIRSWRAASSDETMPFIIVQLPAYEAEGWAMLRESQFAGYLNSPHTGLVVTIDRGEKDNIHPADKRFVGERAALEARCIMYGDTVSGHGPLYDSFRVEGRNIVIKFKDIGGGLIAKENKPLLGFTIAGSDGRFVSAQAQVVGDTVVVYNTEIEKPIAVRYLWEGFPEHVSLFNKEGLPASPFRTDNWNK